LLVDWLVRVDADVHARILSRALGLEQLHQCNQVPVVLALHERRQVCAGILKKVSALGYLL
jgi:hypothetical protein